MFFFGYWKDSEQLIDQVVVLFYQEGRGFTGELACEIICHGGPVVTDLVLESVLKSGARLARPGEFSYRAVLNGKMDLAQAESVLELISAKTAKRASQAIKNIKGSFSSAIKEMDQELIYLLAHLEASIDFTTEDIQPVDNQEMLERTNRLKEKIKRAIDDFKVSQRLQKGLRVVIAGLPNAGKSSLLNALTGKDRSIVTEIAGTTRDVIESDVLLDGQLVKFIDTAGLHESSDKIEKLGIERTKTEIQNADLIIYLVDAAEGMSKQDVALVSEIASEKPIICFNKSDLEKNISTDMIDLTQFQVCQISCATQTGLDSLRTKISVRLMASSDSESEITISSQRQEQSLGKCLEYLDKAAELLDVNQSPDLVSFELKSALLHLKQVLGEDLNDEIMDRVFKEFCIGK